MLNLNLPPNFRLLRCAQALAAGAVLFAAGGGHAQADAPTSATLTSLYSFNASSTDGQTLIGDTPQALTAGPSGALYALTQSGGPQGSGAVVQFQAGGVRPALLYGLGSSSPGGSLLCGASGTLYGTDAQSGANTDGIVYKFAPGGGGYTALHSFSAVDSNGVNADGSLPSGAALQAADGSVYGETLLGGAAGSGVVYKINPNGTGFTVLHSFGSGTDGQNPSGGLMAGPSGFLYGATAFGGSGGDGTLFKIKPDGSGYTVLYQFSADDGNEANADGATPISAPTLGSDGLLYGVTPVGGPDGTGVIYQVSTDGSHFTALYAFSGVSSSQANSDGAYPAAALVRDGEGTMYGTTTSGGALGHGTVFLVTAGGVFFSSLCSLDASVGSLPALTFGSDGTLYGLTPDGGESGLGCLFQVNLHRPVTHVLWTNTNGAASLWNYSAADGTVTQNTYGPYAGWTAQTVADGPDSLTRVLWNNTNGAASLWSLDNPSRQFTQHTYGPYPGWTAQAVSVAPDNTTHVLWTNTNGAASLWNYSAADGTVTQNTYGPYAGWTAQTVADGPDDMTRILWTNANGMESIWSLDNLSRQFTQNTYGPYSGWTAKSLTVGVDNQTQVLWTNTNGLVSCWNYSTDDGSFSQNTYGPYSQWSARAVSDGSDALSRVLWTNTNGAASIWSLNTDSGGFTQHTYGPYAGWTAQALSAGQ